MAYLRLHAKITLNLDYLTFDIFFILTPTILPMGAHECIVNDFIFSLKCLSDLTLFKICVLNVLIKYIYFYSTLHDCILYSTTQNMHSLTRPLPASYHMFIDRARNNATVFKVGISTGYLKQLYQNALYEQIGYVY